MTMLTQDELKKNLSYNKGTGEFTRVLATGHRGRHRKGETVGSLHKSTGYVYIGLNGNRYKRSRLAWLYEYGYFPENQIDHIDRVKNHDWILNLREVSVSCNQKNINIRRTNISGVNGVFWNKAYGKWKAQIRDNNKTTNLGTRDSLEEAICLRLAAEQCMDWVACDKETTAFTFVRDNIQTRSL